MRLTRGEGIMNHSFLDYRPMSGEVEARHNGVLIAFEEGTATFYAMKNAEDRGAFFITPGTKVYKRHDYWGTQSSPGSGTECVQNQAADQPPVGDRG